MTRTALPAVFLLAGAVFCSEAGRSPAQEKKADPAPQPGDLGAAVYRKVLPATVWIQSDRGGGRMATGSGSLIDRGRRLVLTNYHVVGNVKDATVFFPDYGPNKKVVPERQHYIDRANRLGIPGEVVEIDKEGDLALIRLDRVPEGAAELPLAADSPEPGQAVHSIGNPGRSGALWVYTPGKVRQVYSKKWQAKLDPRTVLTFQARVIETASPTNPGDSGGPLVNDNGELVGVTQGGAIDADALSIFVDLSEVRRLVNRPSVQALRSTEPRGGPAAQAKDGKEPAKPRRESPLVGKDDGRFFSEEVWKKAQAVAEQLLNEKGLDLLIETYPTVPGSDADKLRAMTPADREKFLKEFAAGRTKAEKVVGLYVVVNRNPGSLYVDRTEAAAGKISEEAVNRVKQALLTAFREKKFDEGLATALQVVLESQQLGKSDGGKK